MTLQDLEKLVTFYTNCNVLSEATKQVLTTRLFQKYGN